jgi:hypothetical protein
LDKVQIEIIFRPVAQPAATPGRGPQGENRPTPRSWQQRTGRAPGAREARPSLPTQTPPPPSSPAKPEVKTPSSAAKPPSVPAPGGSQGPQVAAGAPDEPPSQSSQGANRTNADAKTSP